MGPSTELIMSWLHITFSHAFSTWSPGDFSMTIILLWPWIWWYLTSWPRCHELQIYKYSPSDCSDLQCVHGGRKHFCLQSSSWWFGPESGQRCSGLIDYDNRLWWGRSKSAKRWHKKGSPELIPQKRAWIEQCFVFQNGSENGPFSLLKTLRMH